MAAAARTKSRLRSECVTRKVNIACALEHFQAKWLPLRVKKMRKMNN
jgi:hypothetical protein